MNIIDTIQSELGAAQPFIVEHRRHLHAHPELSFHEVETCDYIAGVLDSLDVPYRRVAETGIVAHIGSGDRCVALRADIDALPIHEETGREFASTVPGVMHACGHDAHTSMLLGAARALKACEKELPGVVKLLFQPGEEKSPGGASLMIADGALTDPVPEVIFGQHVNPDAHVGVAEFVAGPMMASADELYWTLRGFGAHAAQPHKGKDPIVAAAELISHLQTLVTRQRNPLDAGVISITSIHGGSATNIIPETVEMKGTLRSFSETWRRDTIARLEEHSRALCALHGVESDFSVVIGYPPLINDARATEFARSCAQSVDGVTHIGDFEPKMWAEDFSFYGQTVPAAFWMLGVRPADVLTIPGLHNAKFDPDESAFVIGARMLATVAVRWLSA
ncbi:MAG: M20 family metallopeptidase [Candidatus Kapaibacterium sp.]